MLSNTQKIQFSDSSFVQQPDSLGRFGQFGGKYVPETLMVALSELETALEKYTNEPQFQQEFQDLLQNYREQSEKVGLVYSDRQTSEKTLKFRDVLTFLKSSQNFKHQNPTESFIFG